MFVRWKKRQLSNDNPQASTGESNMSLYAVLVENHRIEGKTRQKVVKYLGYINESQVEDPSIQERFWQQVNSNLEELKLDSEEYTKIAIKLSEVVPNPFAVAPLLTIPYVVTAGLGLNV